MLAKYLRRYLTTVDFGKVNIPIEEKQTKVDSVFHSVAAQYDLMNDLMSLGVHRLWKNEFVSDLGVFPPGEALSILDMAGGTGDIAFRISAKSRAENFTTKITVSDINESMLAVGRERAKSENCSFDWVVNNAEALSFADSTFDIYTIAFGIRNVPNRLQALQEARRVLKPGGRFMCLEFSKVSVPVLAEVYRMYSSYVIPKVGKIVLNDSESYEYLVESIERFPSQQEFADLLKGAGFELVTSRDLTYGLVCIHSALKV